MADKQAAHVESTATEVPAAIGLATRPVAPDHPSQPAPTGDTERPASRPSLADIIAEQERIFIERQPESARLAADARQALAGGVTSSWQISRPQPVWLSHGSGSKLYDVDGNDYVDMHGGYGVSLAGHGHPAIVAAVQNQVTRGTHFAQPTRDALTVARELTSRFGLPQWRFANSGTEATMDAVHLMRAITGRDLVIKVEGWVDRVLREYPGQVAGMILEPIMMNAGIILPDPGYLAGLKDLLHAHDALLAFDEVKTGLTAGPGGATRLTGVTPDIICLAKAIGGGISVAAIGGSHQVMQHVANGDYEMVGTFNGNPMAMAATRAMLQEVATPEAYQRIDALRERAVEGSRALAVPAQRRRLPAAVGQVRAVADIGAARRERYRQI